MHTMAAQVTFSFLLCSNTFHILRPAKAPGFAYAWLELISHRVFIGRMLALTPQQKVHCDFIFDTHFNWRPENNTILSVRTSYTVFYHTDFVTLFINNCLDTIWNLWTLYVPLLWTIAVSCKYMNIKKVINWNLYTCKSHSLYNGIQV